MGEVARHVTAPLLVAGEPVGHGVEGGGQRRDLVVAAGRHAHVQVAGRDVSGGIGELLERAGDAPAHEQAHEQGEHAGDGRRDDEVAREGALISVLGGGSRAPGRVDLGGPHLLPGDDDGRAPHGEVGGVQRRPLRRRGRRPAGAAHHPAAVAHHALAAHATAHVPTLDGEDEPAVGVVDGHVHVVEERHLAERVDGGGVPAVGRLVGGLERGEDGGVPLALHLLEVAVEAPRARVHDDHPDHDDGEHRDGEVGQGEPETEASLHRWSSAKA